MGHGAVVTSHFVKLSASVWVATITDGGGGGAGGECLRVENSAVMEVKMFVEYVVSEESICPAFDQMGSCAPFVGVGEENIDAFWVWKVELHCFDRGGIGDGWGAMFLIRWRCNIHERGKRRIILEGLAYGLSFLVEGRHLGVVLVGGILDVGVLDWLEGGRWCFCCWCV